jgi:hypothetical protein
MRCSCRLVNTRSIDDQEIVDLAATEDDWAVEGFLAPATLSR